MAKTKKEMLCTNCIFLKDGVCSHKSNTVIYINKKIEKIKVKSTELKTNCEFFEKISK